MLGGTSSSTQKLRLLAGVSALAVLAYLPAQFLPFISDDYLHIAVARRFGPLSGWAELLDDPLYRFRALSSLLSWAVESAFGLAPAAFRATSLLFHILCSCLVAGLGIWKPIGWRISVPGAAFFAIAEGHQEAVIWFAAIPELQVFLCVLAAFLCWVRWIDTGARRWYAGSIAAFLLGLLSKESAVCLVGLQALALWTDGRRAPRTWLPLLPFAAAGALYFLLIYSTRTAHQHFNDGTFAVSAPFWSVIAVSLGRLLWIWGLVATGLLVWLRGRAASPLVGICVAWAIVTLLPYSFLTYMPRVPSRHTYLASTALALLSGAALVALHESRLAKARTLACALAGLMLIHNTGYLWTRKHHQYVRRAQPTEELIRFARESSGDIVVECFPYSESIAIHAVAVGAGQPGRRLVFSTAQPCSEDYRFTIKPEPQILAEAHRDNT